MISNNKDILNIAINPRSRLKLADVEKIPPSLPCLMGWKDRNSRYLGITDYMIEFIGMEPRDKLLGKNDSLIAPFEAFSEHYMYCDQIAMNVNPIQTIEKNTTANNGIIEVSVTKHPIYNNALDKVVGVFFFAVPINNLSSQQSTSQTLSSAQSSLVLSSTHYVFAINNENKTKLTIKESRVFYYYLRGRTSKQIANTLSLSFRTVEDHIHSIKNRLNCKSRADIIDLTIGAGLFDFIPLSLMSGLL
ncbi:MAG: helix-turn-helix transcriptional regulator [Legionella sp.]|jgi:DNA-binding CsgD family transcriptional regulator